MFRGSNPSIPYFFSVLCRAKKRKKYTSIFDRYCVLKTKNRASGRLIDRLKARNCLVSPCFCPKYKKNPFCRGRQKRFLSCERAYKRTKIEVRRYKRNVLSVRQTGICQSLFKSTDSISRVGQKAHKCNLVIRPTNG